MREHTLRVWLSLPAALLWVAEYLFAPRTCSQYLVASLQALIILLGWKRFAFALCASGVTGVLIRVTWA